MSANYAVILRRSALLTAPVALLMIVLGVVLGGTKGLIGAALGVGLVIAFFGISALVVSRAARVSPQAMMAAAVGTFLVKIVGSYSNIIGLPLYETVTLLAGEGFPIHFGWLNAV